LLEVVRIRTSPLGNSRSSFLYLVPTPFFRSAHKYITDKGLNKDSKVAVTITTCDTDSLYHPNYFRVLEAAYNASNPSLTAAPRMCVWQPPLFYNWDLDERPFFNRVTGLMRSMMMLGGLISFNLNPMSIFSYPLELGLMAGFINPRYGVDDIIAKVRWMCATNEQVPVLLLPVPVISGPTIGVTFWLEIEEWARQIRRWIVGSSESFHYFIIHFRGQPLFSGLWWFVMFFMYYAVLLCSAGVFSVLAGIPLPWVTYQTLDFGFARLSLRNIGLVALGFQYIAFGVAFIIDRLAIRTMTIREKISVGRNILHWLSAPFVLLIYSLIAFWAIMKFVFVGKGMAKHDMAAKDGLGANTVATSPLAVENSDNESVVNSLPVFVEYDDDVLATSHGSRSRSTSTSKDLGRGSLSQRASKDGIFLSRTKPIGTLATSHEHPSVPQNLLCELPDTFRFGEYVFDVRAYVARVNDRSAV
jgi:hypothetical protein